PVARLRFLPARRQEAKQLVASIAGRLVHVDPPSRREEHRPVAVVARPATVVYDARRPSSRRNKETNRAVAIWLIPTFLSLFLYGIGQGLVKKYISEVPPARFCLYFIAARMVLNLSYYAWFHKAELP